MLIDILKENATLVKSYEKNQIIFNENDLCDNVGIVISGKILIASYTYNGNEIIFNEIKENKTFGLSLIFSSLPFYKGKIISKTKSKIAYISKENFKKILSNYNLYEEYSKYLSDTVLKEKEKNRVLSFPLIKDKILYLLTLHEKIQYNSIKTLANSLAVSREALSRELKKLSNKQLIEITDKSIKIKKTL